ncbi:unnamed protein product [Dovyalis caffra]|uniref:Uncharacterized protein n=1 Tax=Dovyalis caffra TaxID=77055 RepID=A0AAV1SHV6_9ROSI|nr:unnamed protein product [Dovyalis caffra]
MILEIHKRKIGIGFSASDSYSRRGGEEERKKKNAGNVHSQDSLWGAHLDLLHKSMSSGKYRGRSPCNYRACGDNDLAIRKFVLLRHSPVPQNPIVQATPHLRKVLHYNMCKRSWTISDTGGLNSGSRCA